MSGISNLTGAFESNPSFVEDNQRHQPLHQNSPGDDGANKINKVDNVYLQMEKPTVSEGYEEITAEESDVSSDLVQFKLKRLSVSTEENNKADEAGSVEGPLYFQLEKDDVKSNQAGVSEGLRDYDRLDRTVKAASCQDTGDSNAYDHLQPKVTSEFNSNDVGDNKDRSSNAVAHGDSDDDDKMVEISDTSVDEGHQVYDRLDRTSKSGFRQKNGNDDTYQHIRLQTTPVGDNEGYQHPNRESVS